jgi:hypothetical protein
MNGNGSIDGQVLCWPRRVLSADDLRRHLTSQRELQLLPRTIVTPLAADELKARGVRITWQAVKPTVENATGWGYAQERPDATVESAVRALERDGMRLRVLEMPAVAQGLPAVVFCSDPALICCVTNKLSGVRAAVVATPQAAARAQQSLGANLLAIEVPGRTFFELRQMLRTICAGVPACPDALAKKLQELDGHAHR